MKKTYIYAIQILFVIGIKIGSRSMDLDDKHKWLICIARYVVYLLTIHGSKTVCLIAYDIIHKNTTIVDGISTYVDGNKIMVFLGALLILFLQNENLFDEYFPLIFVSYVIVTYQDDVSYDKPAVGGGTQVKQAPVTVNYGVGMACSFFEGYLMQVIPSDGASTGGFLEKIRIYEDKHGVVFPVKKLFIIITKSLYCPPELHHFNPDNKSQSSWLEACRSLENVERNVAGVTRRIYRNSPYKVHRPRRPPVYLVAECATPIHTLHKVLKNRPLYNELSEVDPADIVSDFMTTLARIKEDSPDTRGKCEIVYFDDTDPTLNLSDVLLDRIREIEPNFEEIIDMKQ